MITVKLMGGMGNQLFQYAFGLAQARRLGVDLQVDATHLGGKRPLALNQWQMKLNLVDRQIPTVLEQGMGYNQELVDRIKDGDVLQGYWQNEKYIEGIEEELREMIFVPLDISRNAELFNEIANSESVAVHVRRGDYLVEPHKTFHGVLSLEYYRKAIRTIRDKTDDKCSFFVFSDDPSWVKMNFLSPVVKGATEAEEIYLMSLCKHAIIANSSFSWWGAWLGDDKPGRTVIAPEKWFDQASEDYSGIVPQRWMKI